MGSAFSPTACHEKDEGNNSSIRTAAILSPGSLYNVSSSLSHHPLVSPHSTRSPKRLVSHHQPSHHILRHCIDVSAFFLSLWTCSSGWQRDRNRANIEVASQDPGNEEKRKTY